MRYSTVKDAYSILSEGSSDKNSGEQVAVVSRWSSGARQYSNIQHKVEHDWKMCYLARTQGSSKAFIEWYFDLDTSECAAVAAATSAAALTGRALNKIDLRFETKCFESGRIELVLDLVNADGSKTQLNLSDDSSMIKKTMNGNQASWSTSSDGYVIDLSKYRCDLRAVRVRADLSLGSGDCAWQHTQMFRQSLNDDRCLFDVVFHF